MALIVPASAKKLPDWVPPVKNGGAASANRGSLEANFAAQGECATPEEQKELIFAMLGDYLTCERPLKLARNLVMVATYVRPQKSKGGILYTDKRRDGNRFEGKVGLVIAMGVAAFKYFDKEGNRILDELQPQIGDWVWYRASDAPEVGFRDVWTRTIEDDLIRGSPPSPQDIY